MISAGLNCLRWPRMDKHPAVQGDLHLLLVHPGQLHHDREVVSALVDVAERLPCFLENGGRFPPLRHVAEEALHVPAQVEKIIVIIAVPESLRHFLTSLNGWFHGRERFYYTQDLAVLTSSMSEV